MNYKDAMKKARGGVVVRLPDMNERWGVTHDGVNYVMVSNLGGSYAYRASVSERTSTCWEVKREGLHVVKS
jgi:hypothetical protein